MLGDHLGSASIVLDRADASLEAEYAYDAWGAPRNPDDWTLDLGFGTMDYEASGERGFTGHEMLAQLELVHMNGRIYDPLTGRFLSPDPYVQFPSSTQNYNRYSYVLNNPLKYTDPSGHFISLVAGIALVQSGAGLGTSIAVSAIAGFADALVVHDASVEDAVRAGIIAGSRVAVTSQIGDIFDKGSGFPNELMRAATHGLSGGAFTELSGGDFGSGFAAAFVSSAAGSTMAHYDPVQSLLGTPGDGNFPRLVMRTTIAATLGGTTSAIAGGKFANGAWTAGFVHLYNEESRPRDIASASALGFLEGATGLEADGTTGDETTDVARTIGRAVGMVATAPKTVAKAGIKAAGKFIGGLFGRGAPKYKYVPNPKHGKTQRGNASPAPTNPQRTLDNSIELPGNTTRRIAVDKKTGEFAVFDEQESGQFHGHVRPWNRLTQQMRNVLLKEGLVTRKGKIK